MGQILELAGQLVPELEILEQVHDLAIQIPQMDQPDMLAEIAGRAQMARTYAKAKAKSEELALQASKIAIACGLRLVELGEEHLELIGSSGQRYCLRWIGRNVGVPRAFEALATIDKPLSINQFQSVCKEIWWREEEEERAENVVNRGAPDWEAIEQAREEESKRQAEKLKYGEIRDLNESFYNLVNVIARDSPEVKVHDVAQKVVDELNLGLQYEGEGSQVEYVLSGGVKEMVRQAFMKMSTDRRDDSRSLPMRIDGELCAPPEWVTYRESDEGWIRVPWERATLEQVEFLAQYRELQAQQMARSARIVREILTRIEAGGRDQSERIKPIYDRMAAGGDAAA